MVTKNNTYKGLSFELNENGDICDLIPVEKEFNIEYFALHSRES